MGFSPAGFFWFARILQKENFGGKLYMAPQPVVVDGRFKSVKSISRKKALQNRPQDRYRCGRDQHAFDRSGDDFFARAGDRNDTGRSGDPCYRVCLGKGPLAQS